MRADPRVTFRNKSEANLENEHFSERAFQQAPIKTPTTSDSVELQGEYAALYEKVKGLKHGEVCVYHSGSLAADRLHDEQLNTLAGLVMVERKRIRLCQRRLAEGHYDYLAIGSADLRSGSSSN
jgi:hypothetical protein